MNPKLILSSSAMLLFAAGILLTFLPDEIARTFVPEPDGALHLLLQIVGALYFGFAMLNWMARSSVVGGIYNRPLVVANVSHCTIAGLALIKSAAANDHASAGIIVAAGLYALFAFFFVMLLYRHPRETVD